MSMQVEKTISALKKAYDQPILFHLLYQHMSYLLKKTTPIYEITDDWSKIIIFSCSENNIPNQGLEIKIQSLLKRIRGALDSNDNKLKLMIICYYLLSRPSHLINHIILFDLISNFMSISDYFDGLIISILKNAVISKVFGLKENLKLSEPSYNKLLEIIQSKNLSISNRLKVLVCFVNSDAKPLDLNSLEIEKNLFGFKSLEYICFYAKFTINTSHIKFVLPSDPQFVDLLALFMKNAFLITFDNSVCLKDCKIESKVIFDKIRMAFENSNDKKRFISDVIEYVMNLNKSL